MDLRIERQDSILICNPEGRLDGVNSHEFEESLKAEIGDDGCSVVLNFEDLNYISSAGLRAVLLVAKSVGAKGHKLVLSALPERILEVFEISGFDKIIPIHPSKSEAISAVSS